MVLYFSGTGNSRYVAKRIAAVISDEVISINDRLKAEDTSPIAVDGPLVIVAPTYAWRIPRVVWQWLEQVSFPGAKQVWFVLTCGGEIGNAAKYNRKLCNEKGFAYMGTAQIIMPENYIAMFGAPEREEALQIIQKAEPSILTAAEQIGAGQAFPTPRNNLYDRVMSGPVNVVFYPFCVKADPFVADDKCVGCGKCAEVCPLNNIKLVNGKPVWGKDCTQCMACISYCPTEAIEYGKKSVGKPRYHCDL